MVAFSGANSNSGSLKLNGEWSSIESLPRYLFLCVRRADCAQQKAPSFEPIVNNRQTSHVTSFGFAFWQYCSWGKVFNILLTDHFLTFLYFRALGIWVLKNGKGQQKRQCNVACEPLYTLIFHQITVTCHLLCFRFGTDLPPLRTGHSVRRRGVTVRLPGWVDCGDSKWKHELFLEWQMQAFTPVVGRMNLIWHVATSAGPLISHFTYLSESTIQYWVEWNFVSSDRWRFLPQERAWWLGSRGWPLGWACVSCKGAANNQAEFL